MSVCRQPLSLEWGKPYRYIVPQSDGKGVDHNNGQLYSPVTLAKHVHTHQTLVVYRGLTGPDAGLCFCCPQVDWQLRFKRESE